MVEKVYQIVGEKSEKTRGVARILAQGRSQSKAKNNLLLIWGHIFEFS